jgi:saccharopepsin
LFFIITCIRYDFGNPFASDAKGPLPYIQLLAETNPKTAVTEALASRKMTLARMGPEVSPKEYLKILGSKTSASASTSLDTSGSGKGTDSQSAVEKYAPIVIGLLAANLLIGLVLVALAMLGYVRKGVKGATKSSSAPSSYAAVNSKEEDSMDTAYHMPYSTR